MSDTSKTVPASPTANATETAARPKVLRRPTQFSHKAAPPPAPAISLPPLPAAPPAARPATLPTVIGTSWQEDGRFGALLILIVLLVNVLLAFTLPYLGHPVQVEAASKVTLSNSNAMPSAVSSGTTPITVYSEPKALDDTENSMDLNTLPEEHNSFTTSPDDVPAPAARALELD